ncbi:hypothetical protein THASP1DRAFT_31532, partial [Thamnocephalis sphaerospora]
MRWLANITVALVAIGATLGAQAQTADSPAPASTSNENAAAAATTVVGLPHKIKVVAPAVSLVGEEVELKVKLTWPANETYNDTEVPYYVVDHNDKGRIVAEGFFSKSGEDGELAQEASLTPFPLSGSGIFDLDVYLGTGAHLVATASRNTLPDATVHSIHGWITLLPIIALILVALITKQVLMALFCGVFLSAMFVNFYNPLTGFLRSVDHYMVLALSDPDHDKVLLFTWFLAGLIALIQRSGGAEGLAMVVTKWATTRWRGLWVAFAMGMLIFFDDFASCLIVGTNMVQVTDILLISREKLAFFVHATSSPPASLAPVSSWIGYEVGLIADELRKLGNTADPFMIFLKTIISRFYPIFMIILLIVLNLLKRDFGPMLRAERRAFREGK